MKSDSLKQLDYLQAIEEIEFIFEGVGVPFLFLGETARRIKNTEDLTDLPEIEIGILAKKLSDSSERTLRDRWKDGWKNKTVYVQTPNYAINVPVNIKIIDRDYKFFSNPDQKPYWGGMASLANPFETYWKARGIVK